MLKPGTPQMAAWNLFRGPEKMLPKKYCENRTLHQGHHPTGQGLLLLACEELLSNFSIPASLGMCQKSEMYLWTLLFLGEIVEITVCKFSAENHFHLLLHRENTSGWATSETVCVG